MLDVIVRRANLQTTGTIYNKETQLLAYADDIDIVGRKRVSQPFGMLIFSIGKGSSKSQVKNKSTRGKIFD
jgi:hypothetical protein